jgi:hypothetical protein
MRNKQILLLTFLSVVLLYRCNSSQQAESSFNDNQLKALKDSTDKAWDMMIAHDDQKIKDIQRLIQEVSYVPTSNEMEIKKYDSLSKVITQKRYTQENLDSVSIIRYDNAMDELIHGVNALVRNTKGIEKYELAGKLQEEISSADAQVVQYRLLYDSWSDKYNFNQTQVAPKLNEEQKKMYPKKGTFQF